MQTDVEGDDSVVWLLDYGAGNVRSLRCVCWCRWFCNWRLARRHGLTDHGGAARCGFRNAVGSLGWRVRDVTSPADLDTAQVLLFPGVGAFGAAMAVLADRGYLEPLRRYVVLSRCHDVPGAVLRTFVDVVDVSDWTVGGGDGVLSPLARYVASGRPFFGICIGMQCLFDSSEEAPGVEVCTPETVQSCC